jgi:hypothetical protein
MCCRMDHILLETTGLADPAPLVSILWLDDQLESSIRLDSIITVSLVCFLKLFDFLFCFARVCIGREHTLRCSFSFKLVILLISYSLEKKLFLCSLDHNL